MNYWDSEHFMEIMVSYGFKKIIVYFGRGGHKAGSVKERRKNFLS